MADRRETPQPEPSGGHRRTRRRFRKLLALLGVAVAALALVSFLRLDRALAATFVVDSTADAVDASVGDGMCATDASRCTLRAAIQEANATGAADGIQVPAGTYTLTIAPANANLDDTGDLDVTRPVTIEGAGSATTIVDAGAPPSGAPAEQRGLD